MSTLVETRHPGGFLVWEAFRDYTRDTVTIASGSGVLRPGTILGKITASGKFAAHAPGASNGTQVAAAVLYAGVDATAADAAAVVLVRGPAIVNRHEIAIAGTPTEGQIAAAHTALAALGILVR